MARLIRFAKELDCCEDIVIPDHFTNPTLDLNVPCIRRSNMRTAKYKAEALTEYMSTPEVEEEIEKQDKPGESSQGIEDLIGDFVYKQGFLKKSNRPNFNMFSDSVKFLNPDFHMNLSRGYHLNIPPSTMTDENERKEYAKSVFENHDKDEGDWRKKYLGERDPVFFLTWGLKKPYVLQTEWENLDHENHDEIHYEGMSLGHTEYERLDAKILAFYRSRGLGSIPGIILEVEKMSTVTGNRDLLDLWKCHICDYANHLILVVPFYPVDVGQVFSNVVRRIGTFFESPANYVNVDSVNIIGY